MDDIKFNVRALASLMDMSIAKLAEKCGISSTHLKNVSCCRVKMTFEDAVKLSRFTGVPIDRIKED